MKPLISKEDFVKSIEEIKKVNSYQDELNEFLRKHGNSSWLMQPDCTNTVLDLLHIIWGQADENDWIDYFCFDLEFGEDCTEGSVVDENGNVIDLSSADKLYDYLCSVYE